MFCTNCGQKMEDNAVVCPSCGADNSKYAGGGGAANEAPVNQSAVPNQGVPSPLPVNTPKNKKPLNKGLLIGGLIAVLAIVVIIVFALQPKKYNLEEYVEFDFFGHDGYGTAQISIDETALLKDIFADKGKTSDLKDLESFAEFGNVFQESMILEQAFDTIDLEIDPSTENLSNGDKVEVSFDYDNDVAKKSKIKFTGKSIELIVEGLDPIEEINPFEDIEVSYSGVSPNGSFSFSYTGDSKYVSPYDFSLDKKSGLKNGDVVTVSLEANDEYTTNRGYVFTQKEQKYTISGLNEYISSYADLSEEFATKLKQEAEDAVYSYTANNYSSTSSLSDLKYAGYALNIVKETEESTGAFNALYIIYSGTVSNSAGKFNTSTVYFPVRFANIAAGDEGFTFDSDFGVFGNSNIDGTSSSTKGYTNPYTAYLEIIDARRENSNSEVGDGFEKYAEYENVAQLSDISKEAKEILFADAKDRVESYIASKYSSDTSASEVVLAGEYLLTAKSQGTNFYDNNRYIVVLSATVTNARGRFKPTTVYYPVGYYGFVNLPDNNFMISSIKGILGNTNFPGSWIKTNGYTSGEEMFTKLITAKRDNYTYEVSEGLKELGE